MKKIVFTFIFFASILLGAGSVYAETIKNAGFTGNEILVSNETPVVGESIRLSMPVYNESKGSIAGTVRLYENDKKLAEKAVVLKIGEFAGVSFEWKAIPGSHTFKLGFEDTTIQLPKTEKEVVVLSKREAAATVYTQGSSNNGSLLKEYSVETEDQTKINTTGIDGYRQDFLVDAEAKIKLIRRDISESVKQNEQYEARLNELRDSLPRADGSLLTPLQYVYAWALGAIAYILSNAYLFYGIGALLLFLILRFIIQKFHRAHRGHR